MNLIAVLLALPPLFGVRIGDSPAAIKAGLKIEPAGVGRWSESSDPAGERLDFTCEAATGCFSLPADATFRFVGGQLVLAELRFSVEGAPPDANPGRLVAAAFGDQKPAAQAEAVGRMTRYFVDKGETAAWVQDGKDAHLVIALDSLAPVTRAEAATAGAPPGDLARIPGAVDWQKGHRAILEKRLDDAVQAFDQTLKTAEAPRLLLEPARLLLAMSLAARAQVAGPSAGALADVARARTLAPDMAEDLDELARQLTPEVEAPPSAP